MEQHPIPQDVTGFQFKLIGAMTVKQFGYVAVGVIAAVIVYYLPFKFALAIILKIILIPLFGGSGVILAFVPVEGRPIDIMATHFFNALFSPNQYVYHKQGRKLSFNNVTLVHPQPVQTTAQKNKAAAQKPKPKTKSKEQQLQAILFSSSSRAKDALDEKEMSFLKNISSIPAMQLTSTNTTPLIAKPLILSVHPESPKPTNITMQPEHTNIPTPPKPTSNPYPLPTTPSPQTPTRSSQAPLQPTIAMPQPQVAEPSLAQKEAFLTQELGQAQKEEAQSSPQQVPTVHQKVLALEKQLQEIHLQKQHLEQQMLQLKQQLDTQKTAPTSDTTHVRNIPQNMTKKAGLPHTSDTPNVIVGIVKDPRGNILPSILVEVKDKEGNPVRAFKTNPLGQFASATPLAPGTYSIELEDPKQLQKFDVVQIIANNEILLPLEIISHDAREQLRKELFN